MQVFSSPQSLCRAARARAFFTTPNPTDEDLWAPSRPYPRPPHLPTCTLTPVDAKSNQRCRAPPAVRQLSIMAPGDRRSLLLCPHGRCLAAMCGHLRIGGIALFSVRSNWCCYKRLPRLHM
ncbi:unnamed protein product [Ostreobium quekettii]|uniref:Uncharacterized protein n=1 Tax=Ostreobium quekettii TaxID=121088 RepID=A0A8S1J448_9CHLO|nr:unnamed protein product [Ostreobium quekettii]